MLVIGLMLAGMPGTGGINCDRKQCFQSWVSSLPTHSKWSDSGFLFWHMNSCEK